MDFKVRQLSETRWYKIFTNLVNSYFSLAMRVRTAFTGRRQIAPLTRKPQGMHRLQSIEEKGEASTVGTVVEFRGGKASIAEKDDQHSLSSSKMSKTMKDAFNIIFSNNDEDVHNIWSQYNSLQRRPTSVFYDSPGTKFPHNRVNNSGAP